MSRVTVRQSNGAITYRHGEESGIWPYCDYVAHSYVPAMEKLAAYEDTGLTPEQVAQLQRERDAAVAAAQDLSRCIASVAYDRCDLCIYRDGPCPYREMNVACAFEYCGPQEVEHG